MKEDRYILKFVNGSWVSFDTINYENAWAYFLKVDAERGIEKMNKGGK